MPEPVADLGFRPCPCGCGFPVGPEEYDRIAASIAEAAADGREVRHQSARVADAPVAEAPSEPELPAESPEAEPVVIAAAGPQPVATPERPDPYRLRHPGPTHWS
jgi:hypothetical protein